MSVLEIFSIAVGLAMDASAVCFAASASGYAKDARAVFRLCFHFALFQAFMPVIGWFLGVNVVSYFKAFDHWIAFGVLLFVGIGMIREGMGSDLEAPKKDPSKGMTMVMFSVATSIDAMAIGLSLSMLEVDIWLPSLVIGLITAAMSLLSVFIGSRLGSLFGKRMEIFGGLVLVFIGFRILWSHMAGL